MNPAELYQSLEVTRPLAAQLAVRACLPVRVSPALLRLVRLRLLPQGGIGDEADLWLSDLVETRSAAGFSLRRHVRAYLRERLRRDAALLDEVWQRVHVEHAPWILPRARLEEELTWRLLRRRDDDAIESLWAGVVQELDTGPNADGVARWVVRATSDLPEGTLDHASGRRAYYGSHLLLGDASVFGHEPQRFLQSGEFSFATRRLPRRRIFVGLLDDALLVSPLRRIENGHEIDVPITQPLWLQLETESSPALLPTVITIADHEPVQVGIAADSVTVRAIDGAAYALRPEQGPSRFVARNRAPRVQIEYDVELYGAEKKLQLPFVVGVLAGLSGQPREPLVPLEQRKFVEINLDNFDDVMKRLQPRTAFQVPDTLNRGNLHVELTFERMDDFSPAAVARSIETLNPLLEARHQLANLTTHIESSRGVENLIDRFLHDASLLEAFTQDDPEAAPAIDEATGFEADLEKAFTTTATRDAVRVAMRTLADQARRYPKMIGDDTGASVKALIKLLDQRVTGQLNLILHHDDFQTLEAAWRGLHYLVRQTETDEMLKIRLLNVSKAELGDTLKSYQGNDWDQSPIFKKVYESEYGVFGGEPFGCLVGDYYFDHTPPDVELLAHMAKVSAAAHAPFIAGASPSVLGMASWQGLGHPNDPPLMTAAEYHGWRSLRESEDARYLGLALPRILIRLPYGAKTDPVEEFAFEEDTGEADVSRYTWANAAYAMAANLTRAFKMYGWCARISGIETGGVIEDLAVHTFPTDDGGVSMKCPTEIALSDRREADLSRRGFLPIVHRPNSDFAAFLSARSVQKPAKYDDPDATAQAALAVQLPYLFGCSRFVHYVKCIVRDKIGSFKERLDMEIWLQRWLKDYIDLDPSSSSENVKAAKPLAAAEIRVEEVPNSPGYYEATLDLRPHYQLEGLTVDIRVVTRLPSAKAG